MGRGRQRSRLELVYVLLKQINEAGEDASKTSLHFAFGNYSTMKKSLSRLIDQGFLTRDYMRRRWGGHLIMIYSLTEKGKEVLSILDKLNSICPMDKI